MREYCVEVVNVHMWNQPVFYAGPFWELEDAEQWIKQHKEGYFQGRQFCIKQLIDVNIKQEP